MRLAGVGLWGDRFLRGREILRRMPRHQSEMAVSGRARRVDAVNTTARARQDWRRLKIRMGVSRRSMVFCSWEIIRKRPTSPWRARRLVVSMIKERRLFAGAHEDYLSVFYEAAVGFARGEVSAVTVGNVGTVCTVCLNVDDEGTWTEEAGGIDNAGRFPLAEREVSGIAGFNVVEVEVALVFGGESVVDIEGPNSAVTSVFCEHLASGAVAVFADDDLGPCDGDVVDADGEVLSGVDVSAWLNDFISIVDDFQLTGEGRLGGVEVDAVEATEAVGSGSAGDANVHGACWGSGIEFEVFNAVEGESTSSDCGGFELVCCLAGGVRDLNPFRVDDTVCEGVFVFASVVSSSG